MADWYVSQMGLEREKDWRIILSWRVGKCVVRMEGEWNWLEIVSQGRF
jgi:hypothetical protein